MRRHLDVASSCSAGRPAVPRRPAPRPGNIRFVVGVFVVDHQQAMLAAADPRQREIADDSRCCSRIAAPGRRRSAFARVEFRRVGQHRVAPADHHLDRMARRHRIPRAELVRQFAEGEAGGAIRLRLAGPMGQRRRRQAEQRAAAGEAPPGESPPAFPAGPGCCRYPRSRQGRSQAPWRDAPLKVPPEVVPPAQGRMSVA